MLQEGEVRDAIASEEFLEVPEVNVSVRMTNSLAVHDALFDVDQADDTLALDSAVSGNLDQANFELEDELLYRVFS